MFFIGGTLALVDFKHIYKRVWLFVLTAVKMVIIPIILMFVLKLFNLGEMVTAVIVLQAAMPASTILVYSVWNMTAMCFIVRSVCL